MVIMVEVMVENTNEKFWYYNVGSDDNREGCLSVMTTLAL